MKVYSGAGAATVLLFLTVSTSTADVPQVINSQGRLTDSTGNPVPDNEYAATFTIYAGTAPLAPWNNGVQEVPAIEGLFNSQLGSFLPLPADLFDFDSLTWLGVTVERDPKIVPRTRLVSVPLALHSLLVLPCREQAGEVGPMTVQSYA